MPRWNRDASPDAASAAVRQRFASHLASAAQPSPLLPLSAPDSPDVEPLPDEEAPGPVTAGGRLRWRTPWRVAVLLLVVGAALIAWQLWQSAAGRLTSESLGASMSAGGGGDSGADAAAMEPVQQPDSSPPSGTPASGALETAGTVLVHVAGAVQRPGVVSLPEGSRIFQAIDAAGGAAANADLNGLNLAAVLGDGVKIHVPVVGEGPQAPMAEETASGAFSGGSGTAAGPSGAGGTKVNINTATVEELGTLPRVGPVMAQRIVDWRKEHGPFASVEELDAIDGIGPKLMESLQNLVTVQGG
ncbi:ComEA family DNA-binding protein [Paenarthrobacter sp. NPDC056912]|uniref:ComEA family DNA-binding protein n=1 Tax=Paenarthrobacter sp. NPDC056912 TaxID=3345965 RepID=UPI0036733704